MRALEPARDRFSRQRADVAVFVALCLLIASRAPYVLVVGRFWAEEGSHYFQHMMTTAFPRSLGYVYAEAGYYYLFANVATWLATLVPLAWAPLVTAWLSFAVLAALVWAVLRWPSLLRTALARYVAVCLLVFGSLAHPEVWLNSVNTQTYLGLLLFFFLLVEVEALSPRQYGAMVALAVVAALSGLYGAILAPLFAVRWWQHRTARWVRLTAVVGAGAAIQLGVVLYSLLGERLAEPKMGLPSLGELVTQTSAYHLANLLIGYRNAAWLQQLAGDGSLRALLALLVVSAIAVLGIGALVAGSGRPVDASVWLGGLLLSLVLVHVGALGDAGWRYTVVPVGILSLALAYGVAESQARLADQPWRMLLACALAGAALVSGLSGFWTYDAARSLGCAGCPVWSEEVEAWEAGESDELRIWPHPRWTMELPR